MAGFLSLSTHGFTTTVLITGGGVTPAEGARCPSEVPATAMVTTPAEVGGRTDGNEYRQLARQLNAGAPYNGWIFGAMWQIEFGLR
jgi:hypothetical protein